jgi:quinol monooxygenase YgiN
LLVILSASEGSAPSDCQCCSCLWQDDNPQQLVILSASEGSAPQNIYLAILSMKHNNQKTTNMKILILIAAIMSASLSSKSQDTKIIQLAKLQIDSAQLDQYKNILKKGMETALKTEPGVLSLYAMQEKENPTHITVFEVYANDSAYHAHIASPHFQEYKTSTLNMVKSLEIVRVVPFSGTLQKIIINSNIAK